MNVKAEEIQQARRDGLAVGRVDLRDLRGET
jgi:hypothetical protein